MWWNIRPDVWEILCTFQSTDTEVHVASLFSQDKTGQITTSIKHTNKNVHGHQGEPCSTPLTISDAGCHDNRQFFVPSCISDKNPSLQTRHTTSHKRALLPRLLLGGYYCFSVPSSLSSIALQNRRKISIHSPKTLITFFITIILLFKVQPKVII